jgi:hypothetical protein
MNGGERGRVKRKGKLAMRKRWKNSPGIEKPCSVSSGEFVPRSSQRKGTPLPGAYYVSLVNYFFRDGLKGKPKAKKLSDLGHQRPRGGVWTDIIHMTPGSLAQVAPLGRSRCLTGRQGTQADCD